VVAIRPTAATPFTIVVTHPTTFRRRPLAHRTGYRCRDASRHGDQLPGDQRDHSPRSEFVINGIIAVPLVFLVMIVCLCRYGLREVDPTGTYLT
jgi:hypothetical protein